MKKYFENLGKWIFKFTEEAGNIVILLGQTFRWMFKKPFDRKSMFSQMVVIGINSFPIVTITAITTGMVLALQTGVTLEGRIAGLSTYIGGIVAVSLCRELGPVLTALIVAGRVGSSIAAELGTMKVTEQIDALYTMSANPVKYLAVPRFIACTIMLPVLAIYSDLLGILGGMFIGMAKLNVTAVEYIDNMTDFLSLDDVMNGLSKTVVFGMIIATIGCYTGFTASGGAEGVGRATTRSVVLGSILILIFDYILTAFLW